MYQSIIANSVHLQCTLCHCCYAYQDSAGLKNVGTCSEKIVGPTHRIKMRGLATTEFNSMFLSTIKKNRKKTLAQTTQPLLSLALKNCFRRFRCLQRKKSDNDHTEQSFE